MRVVILFFCLLILCSPSQAQVPESCACGVDTLGYSSFVQSLNPNENANFQFHVHQSFAVAYGVIGSGTPSDVQNLIDNHPDVSTIVMLACPGSEDDQANLLAATRIYEQGYKMFLPLNGWIASGATDMFLAGSTRVVELTDDPVGVHSWSDGINEATDFPVGHPNHQPYIDYYISVGFSEQEAADFYYFTINAAPAQGIHWMTESELDQYQIRTCRYADNPTYAVTQNGNTLTAELAGVEYQWIDCNTNQAIPGATQQNFVPASNGEYAVMIKEQDCEGVSACLEVASVDLELRASELDLLVFPNPSEGQIKVEFPCENCFLESSVWDLKGNRVAASVIQTNKQLILDFDAAPGLYILQLQSGDSVSRVPIIKQ